jgi:PEP-CTERM motif
MKKYLALGSALALAAAASADVLSIVNTIPGAYSSIAGLPGTTAILGASDDSEHNVSSTVGNIAMPAGNWRIGNNGVVVSNSIAGEIGFTNSAITAGSLLTQVGSAGNAPAVSALLPLWDDHFPSTAQGANNSIHIRTDPGVTTIEWLNEDHFSAPGTGTITFQLKVYAGGAGPGGALAQYIYPDGFYSAGAAQNFAGSATIGYLTGTAGHNNVQWSSDVMQPANPDNSMTTLSLVPEPASMALLALGALAAFRRR